MERPSHNASRWGILPNVFKMKRKAKRSKWWPRREGRIQLGLGLLALTGALYLLLHTHLVRYHHLYLQALSPAQHRKREYIVSGTGCHIPDLDPYDPSVRAALEEDEPRPHCDGEGRGVLVKSNLTHLYVDRAVQRTRNLTRLKCCFRPFWRIQPPPQDFDVLYKFSEDCHQFEDSIYVFEEFVRVECRDGDGEAKVYEDFYFFLSKETRLKGAAARRDESMSVLTVGLDALSRLNFRRQMPLTHRYLEAELDGVEFYGYHKVGDNTFPNLVPALAGLSEAELIEACWPATSIRFDNCSFVWDNFKREGFVTGFGEDASWMGIFQYCKNGFVKQPTDVYLRTFNAVYEDTIGHDKRLNAKLCAGNRMNFQVLLDAIWKFAVRLSGKLSFGFFWENSLSHDFLNLPKYSDGPYEELLKRLREAGVSDRSAIIVMSDHGLRWGAIRKTYQGYIEERLPLLVLTCPPWFRAKFQLAWANAKKNAVRLVTPYDLHATLLDLADLRAIKDEKIMERTKELRNATVMPRGISLFLPVPETRTCKHAGITDHWCTCHQDREISTGDRQAVRVAKFIVGSINKMLEGYRQCSELVVKSLLSARLKVLPTLQHATEPHNLTIAVKDYLIRLEAEPGGGVFEATVQHNPLTDRFRLMGSISRSNTYGNSSYCVSNYKLKLYCYCIS